MFHKKYFLNKQPTFDYHPLNTKSIDVDPANLVPLFRSICFSEKKWIKWLIDTEMITLNFGLKRNATKHTTTNQLSSSSSSIDHDSPIIVSSKLSEKIIWTIENFFFIIINLNIPIWINCFTYLELICLKSIWPICCNERYLN